MPMILLRLIRLAMVALVGLGLVGCGRSGSYRYKLTLAVNTPEGVKRGSSVVEVEFWDVSIPERGTMHKLRGEALYLDLGVGARPLIALLTSRLHPHHDDVQHWTPDAGPETRQLLRLYGISPSVDYMDDVPRIARMRGPRKITPADLPDLVTFADASDPKSVMELNPDNLQATLGPGVTWNEITLESIDESVTTGIVQKLPWIPAYFEHNFRLNGSEYRTNNELANILDWSSFYQTYSRRSRD